MFITCCILSFQITSHFATRAHSNATLTIIGDRRTRISDYRRIDRTFNEVKQEKIVITCARARGAPSDASCTLVLRAISFVDENICVDVMSAARNYQFVWILIEYLRKWETCPFRFCSLFYLTANNSWISA